MWLHIFLLLFAMKFGQRAGNWAERGRRAPDDAERGDLPHASIKKLTNTISIDLIRIQFREYSTNFNSLCHFEYVSNRNMRMSVGADGVKSFEKICYFGSVRISWSRVLRNAFGNEEDRDFHYPRVSSDALPLHEVLPSPGLPISSALFPTTYGNRWDRGSGQPRRSSGSRWACVDNETEEDLPAWNFLFHTMSYREICDSNFVLHGLRRVVASSDLSNFRSLFLLPSRYSSINLINTASLYWNLDLASRYSGSGNGY